MPDARRPSLVRALIAQIFLALPVLFIVQSSLGLLVWAILPVVVGIMTLFAAASFSRQNNDWLGVECFDTERYARHADPKLLNPPRRS